MTDSTSPLQPPAATGTRQIVLLGAGPAHLRALSQLAAQPIPQAQVTLLAPQASVLLPDLLGGLVAGLHTLQDCAIAVEPLVQRSGVRWVQRNVAALDCAAQTVQLDDGTTLHFDWLSINTVPVQDRASVERQLPGAREHALFTRPTDVFAGLWPRVLAMGQERALHIVAIGTGTEAAELALAARGSLPTAAVTLVCGPAAPCAQLAPKLQHRLLALLKARRVTVLQDTATSLRSGSVQLGCGADLACDVPLLAAPTTAPPWLADSGLALDARGFAAVDTYRRSTSHSRVFAIEGAADALVTNMAAAVAGAALKPHPSAGPSLQIVADAGRFAVASWRGLSAQGRWVWWLKRWMDRRQLARYLRPGV